MKRFQMNQQSGFTIIEFLIALTILGILTSWAVPAFVKYVDTYRVEGVQRNFASSFKFSQSEAIKRNHSIVMCKATSGTTASCDTGGASTWQQGWHIFDDVNRNGAIDLGGTTPDVLLRQQAPVNDIRFVTAANSLAFSGSGNLDVGAGTFLICIDKPNNTLCDVSGETKSSFLALNSGQFIFTN